jgi:MFS family permease
MTRPLPDDAGPEATMGSEAPVDRPGFRTFLIVWFGQLVSLIGTSLTWFGLSIWVYIETGSVTQLSMMLLATSLPRVLLSPIAGALVDRWDRRWAMILSDGAAGIGTVVIAVAFMTDTVTIGLLVAVAGVTSAFEAFHWPAYQAATSLLVPKERYSQASGMIQMADAAGQLLAPVLGGAMVALGGVAVLIVVDAVTFVFAIATLLVVRFPRPERTAAGMEGNGSLWHESVYGFRYVWRKRALFALLLVFAGMNFVLGFVGPVFIAFMLTFTSETTMGAVMSLGATGMLVGSIVASARSVTDGRIARLLAAVGILGVMMILIGSTTIILVVLVALWIGMAVVPYGSAMSQSIWMAKVEPDVQGRVFSVRSMIAQITNPLALAIAGPLVDGVFVPLMAGDSSVSDLFAHLVGRGPSAGYAAFFAMMGIATIALAVGAWGYGPVRHLERDVPDAVGLPSEAVVPVDGEPTEPHGAVDLGHGAIETA